LFHQAEAAEYKELYHGVGLMLSNEFVVAEKHFGVFAEKESLPMVIRATHLLMRAFINFFKGRASFPSKKCPAKSANVTICTFAGISTWGKQAIDHALVTIWEAQALGASDENDKLGATLVQAHTYLQGALMQVLQKKYAKAAWNIRVSWKHFSAALKALDSFDGSDQVRQEYTVAAKMGVGAFNLALSFMPPTVIFVAKILGVSAEREVGITLLRESAQADRMLSPIAAQILLAYFTTLSSMMGEQTTAMLTEADLLLKKCLKNHPGGVFFLWSKHRYHRSKGQVEEALKAAKIAEVSCKDAPGLSLTGLWQQV
jgi:hypothetical protein